MHKPLHPRDDVDRQYVSRKEGGRGHTSIEDSVDTSIQRLEDFIENRGENWLQPPETIQTKREPAERQWPENNSGKKNNSMDVLSD